MSTLPNTIDHLINEATVYVQETQSILSALNEDTSDEGGSSTEDKAHVIQLLLQYRLSGEDAISFLLKMDHNLLYSLGIQPGQSSQVNRDRLAYAIGNEDLKQILNVLAILTGSLSKIILRNKNHQASFALKNRKHPNQSLLLSHASNLLKKQNQFVNVVHKLHLEIEEIIKLESAGPIFDHIAALRGPISQFYQAVLNGLEQTEQLYHQINKVPVIEHQLNSLIKETEHVLHLMPSHYSPHPTAPLKQFDHKTTSEQLEQKAAAKRLRPFFG